MRAPGKSAIGALIALSLCLPALAAADDEKPDYEIKTKTIEASLTIAAELKAYPGLADTLLAEGKREVAKWRAQADRDRKEMPDVFRDGRHYSYERNYTQRSAIGKYVSIVRGDYYDGGGAHPNSVTNTILWDTAAKKPISVRPFFKETADNGPTLNALAKAIRAALAVEKKSRDIEIQDPDTDNDLARVQAKLLEIGALALAPSTETGKSAGLIVYFSPYAVGSYAEGPYTVFVPFEDFAQYLSPVGAALFGGERPPDDEKND
jgi:hypothetical protein